MGLQHCIGGEEGILNTLFKMRIIFFHRLSQSSEKKGTGGSMKVVSKNSNFL